MPRLDRGSRSLPPCFLPINIGDREKKQKNRKMKKTERERKKIEKTKQRNREKE
jgi:hypothetical protein